MQEQLLEQMISLQMCITEMINSVLPIKLTGVGQQEIILCGLWEL